MRAKLESCTFDDWHDIGPAFEEATEDGPRTRLPDHKIVVVALTKYGEYYLFPGEFGTEDEAAEFAAMVERHGSINPEKWSFWRVCYGSQAYIEYGAASDIAAEKAGYL